MDLTSALTEATAPAVAPQTRTLEEVDAEWRGRMSGKDKAHDAETKTLRDQIAALQGQSAGVAGQAGEAATEAERYKAQAEAATKELEALRRSATVEVRSAKYPHAAEQLGDPAVIAVMDEAKLAALDARLAPASRSVSRIDPSMAPRSAPEDPDRQKTSAELKADLKTYAPDWLRQLGIEQKG
jgi:chromosome segregation ATPase